MFEVLGRQLTTRGAVLAVACGAGACAEDPTAPYVPPLVVAGNGQGATAGSGGVGGASGAGGVAGISDPEAECRTPRQCDGYWDCPAGTRCASCSYSDECASGICGHYFTGDQPCQSFADSYCLE
jgi:hypothetical protein